MDIVELSEGVRPSIVDLRRAISIRQVIAEKTWGNIVSLSISPPGSATMPLFCRLAINLEMLAYLSG